MISLWVEIWIILHTKRLTSSTGKYDRRSQPTLSLISSFEGSSEVLNSALSLKSDFLIHYH